MHASCVDFVVAGLEQCGFVLPLVSSTCLGSLFGSLGFPLGSCLLGLEFLHARRLLFGGLLLLGGLVSFLLLGSLLCLGLELLDASLLFLLLLGRLLPLDLGRLLLLRLLLLHLLLGSDLLAVAMAVPPAGVPVGWSELRDEGCRGRARPPGRGADVPSGLGLAASVVGAFVCGVVVGDVIHVAFDDEHGGGDSLTSLHIGENIRLKHFILVLGIPAAAVAVGSLELHSSPHRGVLGSNLTL